MIHNLVNIMIIKSLFYLYNFIITLATLGMQLYYHFGGKKDKILAHRLLFKDSYNIDKFSYTSTSTVWLHGASLGEIYSAIPLISNLAEQYNYQFIITYHTIDTQNLLQQLLPNVMHQFMPYDNYWLIKKFIKKYHIQHAIWIEQEIFPNILYLFNKYHISTQLINARMSEKSFNRWKKFSLLSRYLLNKFNVIYPVSLDDKTYFDILTNKDCKYLGNLKGSYVNLITNHQPTTSYDQQLVTYLKNSLSFVAISTHANEEEHLIQQHLLLKKQYPNFVTVIIPRHINRREEIAQLAKTKYHTQIALYSEEENFKLSDIILIDANNKINTILTAQPLVFIGKSLSQLVQGGQNLLDPIFNQCCVLFGPNMQNFKNIVTTVKHHEAGIEVDSFHNLQNVIIKLLNNPQYRHTIQQNTLHIANIYINVLDNYTYNVANHIKKYTNSY